MKFFIFSLPRSGSAWLANFLCSGSSYCWHEPLADCQNLSDLAWLLARPYASCGAIDTLAYTRFREVRRSLPDAQFYALYRDLDEIESSSRAMGINYSARAQFKAFTQAAHGCRSIHYSRLHNLVYLKEIWQAIVGTPFDEIRAKQLIEMNVQRSVAAVMARLDKARLDKARLDMASLDVVCKSA